ncbi:alpha-2,8-sialyltransferase 8E isoform X1 [Salmo salar]|uniref:Alpha-2,8-sialyltransferase 8E n=1 Tax=Salmo salar TaxID=8030 RepID=A0A1S3KY35_SALSA|nr:alpha-2,8-sialyltransferase 8E-like isoform X1 [Salmo salar]|eukprot:XP_013983500.1 PREDICTED: alpha-2,8-sialyltransferase 8E-like isoform X2 [Salmo salar]
MLRRRMGYADPTSGRDLLGNRSLCFIFICAFGLVTLLQQILYGKNYIKREEMESVPSSRGQRRGLGGYRCYAPLNGGLYAAVVCKPAQQFSRLKGDETGNWTGPVNFLDDGSLKPARNGKKRYLDSYDGSYDYNSTACKELRQEIMDVKVLTMVKTSELFERWRNLQVCKWQQNMVETNNFKMSLSRCCNAPSFLFTTKRNTPAGTKLRYEVDTSGILPISTEVFKMFPDDMPYSKSQFKKCAVVGNGGIIKNSKCGKDIDSADFVFRCNIPPINDKYSADVGAKTDLVTINPSIITERFQKLEKWRRPFYEVLQNYENSSVVLPAFYNTRNTDVSFRVKYMLDDFDSQRGVFFFHPQYLLNVQRFWTVQGVRAKRLSSGLMLVTAAMELCEEVHLYGFWAFPMNPSGIFITHHYYDNVKPRPGFHAMPHEIFNFMHMHTRGILNVHSGPCT